MGGKIKDFFGEKASGVLLPISTWPNATDVIGTLGPSAYQVADWLRAAGCRYLQILPLCPTGYSNSPFDGPSLFAGNSYFIDLEPLQKDGDLTREQLLQYRSTLKISDRVDYSFLWSCKRPLLKEAGENFFAQASSERLKAFKKYCTANESWLAPETLFVAIKDLNGGRPWYEWKKFRQPLEKFKDYPQEVQDLACIYSYLEWQFQKQWQKMVDYFHKKKILVIGDLPAYAAYDSADVWANQDLFHLDDSGRPELVAGVPPDYFSKTGQRWGNPIPRWQVIKKAKITEAKDSQQPLKFNPSFLAPKVLKMVAQRFFRLCSLVDLVKIDHFRGLVGYGVIPAEDENALACRWVKGAGRPLLEMLKKKMGDLPLIAENLGVITPEVEKLRLDFNLPGMVVFQFAPWGEKNLAQDKYYPPNYTGQNIAYSGTHDNDTFSGWLAKLNKKIKKIVLKYLQDNSSQKENHWAMIDILLNSAAAVVIFPVQDILGLDSCARLNKPATSGAHNWSWRLGDNQLTEKLAKKFHTLVKKSGRI